MAGDHPRAAGPGPDQRADELRGDRIEVGERLVEQQQGRVAEQRPGDSGPLRETAGERADVLLGAVFEPGGRDHLVDPPARQPVQPRVVVQVFADREIPVEQRLVGDEPDLAAQRPALTGELVPEDAQLAAVVAAQPGEQRKQRGLAGPVGAQQRDSGTGLDPQRQVAQDGRAAVSGEQPLGEDRRDGLRRPDASVFFVVVEVVFVVGRVAR